MTGHQAVNINSSEDVIGPLMGLYLSSYRLGNHAPRLVELVRTSAPRVLATMNGLDGRSDAKRQALYERLVGDFSEIGADVKELDLRCYFSNPDSLLEDLSDCDLVWARGETRSRFWRQ